MIPLLKLLFHNGGCGRWGNHRKVLRRRKKGIKTGHGRQGLCEQGIKKRKKKPTTRRGDEPKEKSGPGPLTVKLEWEYQQG